MWSLLLLLPDPHAMVVLLALLIGVLLATLLGWAVHRSAQLREEAEALERLRQAYFDAAGEPPPGMEPLSTPRRSSTVRKLG